MPIGCNVGFFPNHFDCIKLTFVICTEVDTAGLKVNKIIKRGGRICLELEFI